MKPLRHLATALGLACASLTTLQAHAQWPEKPIRFVVPYSPGSMGDVVARSLGEELHQRLGQPIIVDNKPGAGGNIGTQSVVMAPPDGQTFLLAATNNFVVNQYLYSNLKWDPLVALEPVTVLVDVPSVFFINAAVPANDVKSFAAWAKANPGRANYGSPGNGTTPHLSMYAIDMQMGTGMAHIPYAGAGQAVQALLAGDIQAYLGGAGLGLAQVRAGKLKALAVSADSRLDVLPDTPTFAEAGIGQVKASNWWALAAPKGTPADVVQKMAQAVADAFKTPGMKTRTREWGVLAAADGPQAMAVRLRDEARLWQRVVKESGAKVD